jgi:hypothetical protein
MAKGYIYVVTTVQRDYFQRSPRHIPVWVAAHRRLYLGPCKVPIRRTLAVGDTVFGISPSATRPRRIVFAAKIAQKVTYRTAYARWPALHGPDGPIHVKPVDRPGRPFPECAYAFIPGSMHATRWKRDLASPTLDGFFVCGKAKGRVGH